MFRLGRAATFVTAYSITRTVQKAGK